MGSTTGRKSNPERNKKHSVVQFVRNKTKKIYDFVYVIYPDGTTAYRTQNGVEFTEQEINNLFPTPQLLTGKKLLPGQKSLYD